MTRTRFQTDERGVSSTLGFLLIVSMVILSTTALVIVGGYTISQSQDNANEESINQGMTQLDSQMSLVAFEGGTQQTIDLAANSDEQVTVKETGHITLELKEINETDPTDTDTVAVIMDRDLGSLQYQTGERTVAYQGGGVWEMRRGDPSTAQMVSPPEFTYTEDTATLPFVGVQPNDDFVSDDGVVTLKEGSTEGMFPQPSNENLTNPVDPSQDLVLTIESDYYQAWGQYFENRLQVTPSYDHANNTVELILVSKGDDTTVKQGITSVAADNRIKIDGQGGSVFIDSYDSRNGTYSESQTEDGEIAAKTGIEVTSGAEVLGDVFTEGDVILSGNAVIHGDATYNGNLQTRGGNSEVKGDTYTNTTVEGALPVDRVIEAVREDFSDDNHNNDSSRIENGQINENRVLEMDNDPTVHAGKYYLSEFHVGDGETVTFNVSNGDVRVVVDDDIRMNQGDIRVVGTEGNSNRVQIFSRGDTMNFDRSTVAVEGDRAPAIWFYGGAGTYVELQRSDVTGVLYTPGTDAVPGEVYVHTHSDLYGGVVGGDTSVGSQSAVHYDQALFESETFIEEHHVEMVSARISYFHISYTEIEVEDG